MPANKAFNDDAAYDSGSCRWCGKETSVWDDDARDYLHEFCRADWLADQMAGRVDAAHDAAQEGF